MSLLTVRAFGATHPGCRRALNEDAFLVRSDQGLWVVCDGVGGHDAGDVASHTITQALDALPPARDAGELVGRLRQTLGAVNHRLRTAGGQRIIASTVVALLARGRHAACLWAGDSRAYRLRNGVLEQISRDHSLVQELIDSGHLRPEQAEHHPKANVVTRAVGATDDLNLDKVVMILEPGDLFLLCSDGLSKVVSEDRVTTRLASEPLATAADALIAEALAAGAPDNVTIVVIAFDADEDATQRPGPRLSA